MTPRPTPTPRADTGPGLSGVTTQWEGVTQVAMTLPDPVPSGRARKGPQRPAQLRVVEDYPDKVAAAVLPVWSALAAEFEGRRLYVAWAQQCRGPLARWSRVKLTTDERRPLSRRLAAAGMSARGVATLLGVQDQTIRADLGQSVKRVKTDIPAKSGEPVKSDIPVITVRGCERCESPRLSEALRQAASLTGDVPVKTLRVLRMAEMVPEGITAWELELATGWSRSACSGILTPLGKQGRLACSVTRREGFTAYIFVS